MASPTDWSRSIIDRDTIIARAQDPTDDQVWLLIDNRYRPRVIAFAKHVALDAVRAEEVAQVTMGDFAIAVRGGRYDPKRGRLRDLLFAIAKKKIADARKRVPEIQSDTGFFPGRPSNDGWQEAWDREWASAVATQCIGEARDHFFSETYRMFHLKVIEERPSREVAEMVGKDVGAVDMATHHVKTFLKQIHPEIERIF